MSNAKSQELHVSDETYTNYLQGKVEENQFEMVEENETKNECNLLPNNKYLIKFDFLTCVLVFYDCFMVPFKNTYGDHFFSE